MTRKEYFRRMSRGDSRGRFPLKLVRSLFAGAGGAAADIGELWDLLGEAVELGPMRARAGLRASRSLLATMRLLEAKPSPSAPVHPFPVPPSADALQEVA